MLFRMKFFFNNMYTFSWHCRACQFRQFIFLFGCVTNDHGYVPLVVITYQSFPHSWVIIGFVTRLTRRVPLVEQEVPTLLEHLNSLPVFSGVRVTRSLVLCVCFVDRYLSYFPVSFCHCVVCSSIYVLWLPPFDIFKLFLNIYVTRMNLAGHSFLYWVLKATFFKCEGTAYPSGAHKFIPSLSEVRVSQSLVFCVVFCWSFFVLEQSISFKQCI
jgi:hypothetical protein